jgi:hypothetical protein
MTLKVLLTLRYRAIKDLALMWSWEGAFVLWEEGM